jgi:quinoprotein glucose dehydrogenase
MIRSNVGQVRQRGGRNFLVLTSLGVGALFAGCSAGSSAPQSAGAPGAGPEAQHLVWDNYGGGPDASKYVAYTQINKQNVSTLEVAWEYETGDANPSYPHNPVIVDGVMYVFAKNRSIVALDAETGEELWIHARLGQIPVRGLNLWRSEDGSEKRILFVTNNYLQAIDATTGQSILDFGNNGLVDLKVGVTPHAPEDIGGVAPATPGVVYQDLIILGSAPGENWLNAPGHIRAYNATPSAAT